ncbi:MAG: fibronectin type III domain-containing protein [Candidatus Saccharibacteria bacterium]|nr:fibronectin type III domain-containing protein [Candidatus Saccharibacteria bacterium]
MMRRNTRRTAILLTGVFAASASFAFLTRSFEPEASAAKLDKFDPGNIISDYMMGKYDSMTEQEIQAFLTEKNSCNNKNKALYDEMTAAYKDKGYVWHWKDDHFVCLSEELFGDGEIIGEGDTAAHIIWQAAQDYKINPQALLVLLQKETSLITDTYPNNRDYRKATGYGCPDTAACSEKYYGFKNQVRSAAALFSTVLTGGWTNFPLGENYIQYNPNAACGGSMVNIKNLATSALYRYTPYQPNAATIAAGYSTAECGAYGNRNFYLYFSDWFGDPTIQSTIQPENLTAKLNDDSQIVLSWEISKHATETIKKYEIVILDKNNKEYKYETKDAKETTFTAKDLPAGEYKAASVKSIGEENQLYSRITFSFKAALPLSAPKILDIKKVDAGVEVSWQKPTSDGGFAIEKYEIVVKNSFGVEYKEQVTDAKLEKYTLKNLPAGVYTKVKITVFNKKKSQSVELEKTVSTLAELEHEDKEYKNFKDMPKDDISKKAVSWAVNNGITDKNDYFNGEQPLTRRQAMVLLWRISGQPTASEYKNFKDMPKDDISKKAVSWAVNNGITDKNDYFNGEQPLTRRQAMVILWRYTKLASGLKI